MPFILSIRRRILGILSLIKEEKIWRSFFDYKKEKAHLSSYEEKRLSAFIEQKRYMPVALKIEEAGYCFDYPSKKLINKLASGKKRVVYSYKEEETAVLKLIAFLLYKYDGAFSPLCYSFRKNFSVKRAIRSITSTKGINDMLCYKADIRNYFNSIDIELLLPGLRNVLYDDTELYEFLERLLRADKAYFEGTVVEEKRGIMAGTPISPFLANLYLNSLDEYFFAQKVTYARYSDDIILFAPTEKELDRHIAYLKDELKRKGLEVNTDKEYVSKAGEGFEFLGVEYRCGNIDLSAATKDKIKGKIRRKARSIYRWKVRKGVPDEKALSVFSKRFNQKFFDSRNANDLTWSRWFFPLITVDSGLKETDAYMQQYMRYIVTGKHGKSNYKTDYLLLKSCGYRSLVNEYYKFLSDKAENNKG